MSHYPFPSVPTLGDLPRLVTGDRVHHGFPPQTIFKNSPVDPDELGAIRLAKGVRPGGGAPVGDVGDWWLFTVLDLEAHDLGSWVQAADRALSAIPLASEVRLFFNLFTDIPLIWEVPPVPTPAFQPHYRLAFGGPCFAEEWSCRLNITSSGALPNAAAADAMLPGLVTALSTWVGSDGALLSSAVALDQVKFNEILPNGKYADGSSSRVSLLSSPVPGVGTPHMPPQVAVVVSLLTGHARGKAHRGRMFTPALAASITGSGFINGTTGIATAATALLAAINAVVTPAGVSVISTTGQSNHVTGVAVGQVFDTMRTRRRSLSEATYALGAAL